MDPLSSVPGGIIQMPARVQWKAQGAWSMIEKMGKHEQVKFVQGGTNHVPRRPHGVIWQTESQ